MEGDLDEQSSLDLPGRAGAGDGIDEMESAGVLVARECSLAVCPNAC